MQKRTTQSTRNKRKSVSLRKVTGCTKTSPVPSLMAKAAEIPLSIKAKYLASNKQAKEIAHSVIHRNLLCDTNLNCKQETTISLHPLNEYLRLVCSILGNWTTVMY